MSLLSVYGPSYQSIGPSYQSIGPSYQSTGRSIVLQLRSPKLQFNTNQGDFYNATMITWPTYCSKTVRLFADGAHQTGAGHLGIARMGLNSQRKPFQHV